MEPVTHVLTGAVLARCGFNRRTAYATAAMAVAAEFPDIDTLWAVRGPVESFQHHRGFTHTVLGFPAEALFLLGGFWLFHHARRSRLRSSRSSRAAEPVSSKLAGAEPRWGVLLGCILLALCSHVLLDWMNNYGVRPLFPFDRGWHAASLVFIFDPLLFIILVAALVLPSLFRLINSEVGAAPSRFPARSWALGALLAIAALIGLRGVEHARARGLAVAESAETGTAANQPETSVVLLPRQVLISPDPLSPFRWHGAADFGAFVQLEEIDSIHGTVSPSDERLDKAPDSPDLAAAKASHLGQVYLDWSPMPVLSISQGSGEAQGGAANTVVFFRDPRFMGDSPLLHREGSYPLTGTVELDARHRVVTETMDGRQEPRR